MIYKSFGKTGYKVSALGFGAMRLPMAEGGKAVDKEKAAEAIIRAYELGVNYFDTAPYYCESGSEEALGLALRGIRGKVYLSTKNPVKEGAEGWRGRLERSLSRLGVDCIDFYHMWGIDLKTFQTKIDCPGGAMPDAVKAKEEGLIKHLSFSFHDDPANMPRIIDSGYFESVLMQYNLLDRSNEENLRYAKAKGLGTVVMGPVGGGRLGAPSEVIRGLLGHKAASSAEMALRFVLANPNVDIALSGMGSVAMVEENAATASIPGTLTPAELETVNSMLAENKRLSELYCTGCEYCMPCPNGINIPHIFTLMNYHRVYKITDYSKAEYAKLKTPLDERPAYERENGLDVSLCVECGQCEGKCPQKLKIIEQLKETAGELE